MQILSFFYQFLDRGASYYILVRVAQFLLGTATSVLIASLASLLFGRKEGIVAGLMSAMCWQFIYYEGELLMESLLVFLLVMIMHSSLKMLRKRDVPNVVMSAAWIGVCFLCQTKRPRCCSRCPGVSFVHQEAETGRLVRVRSDGFPACTWVQKPGHDWFFLMMPTQGGVNFSIGNNPHSDGMTAIVPGTRPSWEGGYDDTMRIAESNAGRKLTAGEISGYWFKQGMDYVAAKPGKTALMYLKKFRLIFNNEEISNNQNVYYSVRYTGVLRALPGFALIAPFALAGVVFFIRNKEVVFLLSLCAFYLASFIPFFMNGRYRLPVLAFFIVLAAAALVKIARIVIEAIATEKSSATHENSTVRTFVPVLKVSAIPVLAAMILLVNNTPVIRYDDGDYELAITWLRKGEVAKARELLVRTSGLSEPFGSMSDISLGSICVSENELLGAARYF